MVLRTYTTMYHIGWFLLLLSFYSSILSAHSETKISPLIFNPYTLKIYDPETDPTSNVNNSLAFACPAVSEKDNDFIEHVSSRRKSLIVRKFSTLTEEQITCEDGFELSAAFNYEGNFIEFGYEVYFERSQYPEDYTQSNIRNFGWITEANQMSPQLNRLMISNPFDSWDSQKVPEKWGFVWISKVTIKYDLSSLILKTLNYSIHPINANQLEVKCNDNELGKELYDLDRSNTFNAIKNSDLEKYNLLMPYHYQASVQKPVSCSNLTMIPFYYVKAPQKILHRLEIFLIAIAQTIGKDLMIRTGVRDILTYEKPSPKYENKVKWQKIYLYYEQKKVPVPKFTYKIVQYKSSEQCNENEEVCWFDLVIVIHNQSVYAVNDYKLCTEDKCSVLGWDSIQYLKRFEEKENKPTNYSISCCSLDKRMEKLLNFKRNEKIKSRDLNLKEFPVYNESTGQHETATKQYEFEQNMYHLLHKYYPELV